MKRRHYALIAGLVYVSALIVTVPAELAYRWGVVWAPSIARTLALDGLDGWLARRGQQVTRIGVLLDPLADKLLVSSALIVLLVMDRIPAWATFMVVVIIGRELAVTGLRGIASAGGQVIGAAAAGKLKTVFQNIAIGALLFPDPTLGLPAHAIGLLMLSLATALTAYSGFVYFAEYFRAEGAEPPGGGPAAGGAA